jgi:2-phosphosulfolactate phosphatase
MMDVRVVPLPAELRQDDLRGRVVAVVDQLRATTTIPAMLAAGAAEVRVFATPDQARAAAAASDALLAGERKCRKIEGFDLGNSPRLDPAVDLHGRVVCLTTTNGTRAILAATEAEELVTASLANNGPTAAYLRTLGRDVTILCSGGEGGRVASPEDEFAAADLRARLLDEPPPMVEDLATFLHDTPAGRFITAAGLRQDVDFIATARFDVVCRRAHGNVLRRVEIQAEA